MPEPDRAGANVTEIDPSRDSERGGPPILIGVSACLLGERVRYDGADQRDPYVSERLARRFCLIPVCPEVAIGLGVPRRPIRLVRTEQGVRVRDALEPANPELDLTDRFQRLVGELAPLLRELSGFVFKSGSPSCGLRQVRLYEPDGRFQAVATGELARLVRALCPGLPVIDEQGLADSVQRRRFLARVMAPRRAAPPSNANG